MANGTATFDTHEFVTDMTAAKMPEKQAEILAKTYAHFLNDRLVTREHLHSNVDQLRSEIRDMESRLTIKFLIMQIALYFSIIGTMFGLINFLN